MKILYAIQGTGNGHLSRARDIIPILQKKGSVDILVSGIQADVQLPFAITYQFKGLSFIFGKKGGIDIWETYKKSNSRRLYKEIKSLPVENYDIIINDFEPVSAWAAKLKNIPIVALSHQAAVLHKNSPKPKNFNWLEKQILRYYAPTKFYYGFHFDAYDDTIFSPVIRQEIRNLSVANKKHYTVYLPAYSDKKIISILSHFKKTKWHVFSKHTKESYLANNVMIFKIDNQKFIQSLASSEGVLCGAGFETPAEALFLQKKLLVIPMKTQFEQKCNATALEKIGVPVIKRLSDKYLENIASWIASGTKISMNYPDETEKIINLIFSKHVYQQEDKKSFNKLEIS